MDIWTKIGRAIRWTIINSLMVFLLYMTIFGQAPYQLWADRAFTFFVYLMGIVGWIHICIPKEKLADGYKTWTPVLPAWLDQTYDWIMLAAVASQGWWWMALMYVGITISSGQLYKMYEDRKVAK